MTARERRGAVALLRACGGDARDRRRSCSRGAAVAVAIPAALAGVVLEVVGASGRSSRAWPRASPSLPLAPDAPARSRSSSAACSRWPRSRPRSSPAACCASPSSRGCGRSDARAPLAARRCSRARARRAAAATRGRRAARRGSTLRATLVDPDGDGFLERRAGRAARRPRELGGAAAGPRRWPRSASSPTRTCATRSRPRACRSWTGSAPPFTLDLPPAGGVLRPRCSTPPCARSTASTRRPSSSPATSPTTRRRTSSTWRSPCCAAARVDPDSGAPGYDGVQDGRQPRPVLLPPRQRRPAPPRRCSTPRSGRSRAAGLRRAVVPGGRQPRRARAGRGAAPRPRSSASRPATGWSPASTRDVAAADRRGAAPGRRRRAARRADGVPGRTRDGPADPRRRHLRPPRWSRGCARRGRRAAGRAGSTTRSTSGRACAAIVLDTVDRDGGSRGARRRRRRSRGCGGELAAAGDRWVVVFSHNPLDLRRRRGGARRARRRRQRRRRDRRQPPPQRDRARPATATG